MTRAVVRVLRDLHPLALGRAGIAPELVLVARFLALVLLLQGERPFPRWLPYLRILDQVGTPNGTYEALQAAALAGYGLIFFTRFVRLGAGIAGLAFLYGLLACRPLQSVAHTYVACVFIMIALSTERTGAALLRAQMVVLYFGAGLNKALDPDWWNGRYFETFLIARHHHAAYAAAAAALPPLLLSKIMGAATIGTQAALLACFLRPRWYVPGIVLGLFFHGVMIVWLNESFGPFVCAVLISYLAFAPRASAIEVALGTGRGARLLGGALTRLDPGLSVRHETAPARRLRVTTAGGRALDGLDAVLVALISSPVPVLASATLLSTTAAGGKVRAGALVLTMALGAVGLWRWRRMRAKPPHPLSAATGGATSSLRSGGLSSAGILPRIPP